MKRQALYDTVWERAPFALRIEADKTGRGYPDRIVIPTEGYCVPRLYDEANYLSIGPGSTDAAKEYSEDWFDSNIDRALDNISTPFLFIDKRDAAIGTGNFYIHISPAEVFNTMPYAMGYAHGAGIEFIIRLRDGKRIHRK